MTNNPFKLKCLKAMGVEVLSRIPMLVPPNVHSLGYLQAKAHRMSHLLHQLDDVEVDQEYDVEICSWTRPSGQAGLTCTIYIPGESSKFLW